MKLADTIDLIVQLDMDTANPDGSVQRQRWCQRLWRSAPAEGTRLRRHHRVPRRRWAVAFAHTLPDELRRLERHGFDVAAFWAEARTRRGAA